MGWPVDSAYHQQSNITMAANLKGKLLLVHGGIDENVNPSATFKLAENLVKADKEFDGMKGREWLMKWLPARAYDNAIYVVFSNPIGMDDDQLKNGCSMIIDPFGDILAECRTLGDDIVSAILTSEKLTQAGGYRYIKARKPDLYRDIIGQDHIPEQKVIWINDEKE